MIQFEPGFRVTQLGKITETKKGTKMHPRIMDHSPAFIDEIGKIMRDMSHWEIMDGTDFDNLQNAANLLEDWADMKRGVTLKPEPTT